MFSTSRESFRSVAVIFSSLAKLTAPINAQLGIAIGKCATDFL